jgi:hypothetical protein
MNASLAFLRSEYVYAPLTSATSVRYVKLRPGVGRIRCEIFEAPYHTPGDRTPTQELYVALVRTILLWGQTCIRRYGIFDILLKRESSG